VARLKYKAKVARLKAKKKKAIVLLSGGLDSSTTLFYALKKGYDCFCLIFDYSQRHKKEIESAKKIARYAGCKYRVLKVELPKSSALTSQKIKVPQGEEERKEIPITYVPARNTLFIAYALSWAEGLGAEKIFIGANAIDYSGYPDCRPEYYSIWNKLIKKGTKAGVEGKRIKIETPLIKKTKKDIVKLAVKLKVPLHLTWSCYRGGKKPCRRCDSCILRAKGFKEAGIPDPLLRM